MRRAIFGLIWFAVSLQLIFFLLGLGMGVAGVRVSEATIITKKVAPMVFLACLSFVTWGTIKGVLPGMRKKE
ncbi:hypothetical protein ACFL2I_06540 [Candidatus Omnitrophota bacterium]